MPINYTGITEMKKRFSVLRSKLPSAVGIALYQVTERIATECKRQAPVDTGNLRASIFVGPIDTSKTAAAAIVCGGPAAPYAAFVHENLTAHHPVGNAKFIEGPILEARGTLAADVAAQMDLNAAMEG